MTKTEEQAIKDVAYFFFLEAFNSLMVGVDFMYQMEGMPYKRKPLYTADDWIEGCRKMREKKKK